MYDIDIEKPKIYKKINSENYLVNCYKYLMRTKTILFILILIEMILNLIQQLETYLKLSILENSKNKKYYIISSIIKQFGKIQKPIKIVIILLILIITSVFYFIISKKRFTSNYITITFMNILELFYFRTIMIIFLNIYFSLPNLYYLFGLILLIPHLYLIINNFLYNHLYYFVPRFIEYPFDEFTSLFDIILLFLKIILSVAGNTNNKNIKKLLFIILFVYQVFFSFYFIYKLIYHSYLFMKNSFLNKTKVSFFFSNTIIIFIAILFGKEEIITVLFLTLIVGIFFIIMAYMHLIYNPYHYIRINIDTKNESIFLIYAPPDNCR